MTTQIHSRRETPNFRSKVLLVDDEEDLLAVLKSSLELEGLEVFTAIDGPTAKDLVDLYDFNAVITDISMPGGMSGLELLKQLRVTHPFIPVVLMTGLLVEGQDQADLGAKAYLSKPFTHENLVHALRAGCELPMKTSSSGSAIKLEFQRNLSELNDFIGTSEELFHALNLKENQALFVKFSAPMCSIFEAAQLAGKPEIAKIAKLGQRIVEMAVHAETRSLIRKCSGSLWDILTTTRHLLSKPEGDIAVIQNILIIRLYATLGSNRLMSSALEEDETTALLWLHDFEL